MCNHKIRLDIMRCLRNRTVRREIGQYEKSARYNDVTTMEKILSAQTPTEAKLHGSRV